MKIERDSLDELRDAETVQIEGRVRETAHDGVLAAAASLQHSLTLTHTRLGCFMKTVMVNSLVMILFTFH